MSIKISKHHLRKTNSINISLHANDVVMNNDRSLLIYTSVRTIVSFIL